MNTIPPFPPERLEQTPIAVQEYIRALEARVAALEATDSGRLMLTNVLFAFRTKRPSEKTLLDLFAAVMIDWSNEGGRRADSIVMSTHGRSGLTHLLIGSVAEKVVRHATVPVLTVRVPDKAARKKA